MKVACLSFTSKGREIGEQILKNYEQKPNFVEAIKHFHNSSIKGGIKTILPEVVRKYDGIVFISATGIAIRMMIPFIKDKKTDPAIVVVDDLGRYSISLLSGHIGGANTLSKEIGNIIDAKPIITTASDSRGIEAVDMYAIRNNLYMKNMNSVKKITALMIEGKKIGFYSEIKAKIGYSNLIEIEDKQGIKLIEEKVDGILLVTSQKGIKPSIPYTILRPQNLNIGIGCRKGTRGKDIINSIIDLLNKNSLSEESIKSIGTVSIKKNEKGIIEASEYFSCPMNIFTKEEIKKVEDSFQKSQFVKEKIGVYGVSEPSAYLSGGNLIVDKTIYNGITLAISKEVF